MSMMHTATDLALFKVLQKKAEDFATPPSFEDQYPLLLPLGAVRGCSQTLFPLSQGHLLRTVSGHCLNLGVLEKYGSVIKCQDKEPPTLEDLWPGVLLKVACIQPLMTHQVHQEKVVLKRPAVEGSVLLMDENEIFPLVCKGNQVHVPKGLKGYISYRPFLYMIVKNFSVLYDEWKQSAGWVLELEEY